jgi:CheY-like chemotaxis protein
MNRSRTTFLYDRVLLVDDNELDNFINRRIMDEHSFAATVYCVSNGQSAIDFLKNLQLMDAGLHPQVILIDLNMPLLDGFQLLEYCTKDLFLQKEGVELVVLTSSVNPNDRTRARAINDKVTFLNKPLTRENLSAFAGTKGNKKSTE